VRSVVWPSALVSIASSSGATSMSGWAVLICRSPATPLLLFALLSAP
jgi:hypothetical protein